MPTIFSKPLPPATPKHAIISLLFVLLLARERALDLLGLLRRAMKGKARVSSKTLNKDELNRVLQEVYEEQEDGSKVLLVPYRDRVVKVPVHTTPKDKLTSDAAFFPSLSGSAKSKPNIGASFVRQLRAILFRVAFPSWRSKEMAILAGHSFFLVMRTVLSIMVARLDGRIVRDLVKADGKGFLKGLALWFILAVPSTYTNTMIKHLQSLLSLSLRTKLTRYTHDLYLSAFPELRYYRLSGRLDGADQYLTADVEAWSESISVLYGNILKPSLDLILFTSQLSRSLGVRGTLLLFANYYATVRILRAVTPAFGRLAAVEARLEGEYRRGMGRVGREGEEVAFYDGGARERDILTNAYMRLIKHVNSIYKIRIAYEWTEDYVIKYLWSAAGYALIAVPLLFTRTKRSLSIQAPSDEQADNAIAGRTETYISNRRLLLSLADAGGRLMYAYKDLLELAGLTTRLYTLLSTLHNLPPLPVGSVTSEGLIEVKNVDISVPTISSSPRVKEDWEEDIDVEDDVVPLVKDLNLTVREGEHLMITGSNGVGKTAVARVLAGLWPPRAASIHTQPCITRPLPIPSDSESHSRPAIFVVPQRAYMVSGSLLEQIIYPHSYRDFVSSKRSMEEIKEILEMVYLSYLPDREGGWGTRKEWRDVLSGGEKQRMGMARVFYHRPRFAILDECTSAVSSDVEGRMYESAKSLGITLITISLRASLMKYHTQLLTLSGDGTSRWTLTRLGTKEERMGLDREIASLEKKLAEVEGWERRVKELEGMLSVTEVVDGDAGSGSEGEGVVV